MKILVADDSKTTLTLLTISLSKLNHDVIEATSGMQAIELFQAEHPDLVILDVVMEGMDGFECAKKLRALNDSDWIPIIFLSGSVDDESIAKGIDAGGDDYLTKPFSEITLAAKIKAMQRIADMQQKLFELTQNLSVLSSTDTLTGLYNRMQFDKTFKEKIAHANRHLCAFALLFIDLDKFKSVNDLLGHHIGDMLLAQVANRLKTNLRADDFIARIGGDEFAVILSEITNPNLAGEISQKIIDVLSVPYNLLGNEVYIGASVGIAFYPYADADATAVLQNADTAMYYAKKSGRNNYQYFTAQLVSANDQGISHAK